LEYSNVVNISDKELIKEYKNCDLVIFASTYEGFGLPIVEAQATGRAVITSNVCSMPEVAGNAACLVDPLDPMKIRAGILKVIHNSKYRNDIVKKGLKNVSRFRAKKIAYQYASLYKEIYSKTHSIEINI
jgi:glycosyltransferase involved in cell wall biosynthesis